MHPKYEQANTLTKEVIDAACEVRGHFNIGLLESIYQRCLAHELRLRGHTVKTEAPVTIRYKDFAYEENLRVDLLVDDCLIVECKALDEEKVNMPRHKAQTLSYMKLMDIPIGLVINFCDYRLPKSGVARVILKDADKLDADF